MTLGDNAVKVFDVGPGDGPKDANDKGLNEQVLKKYFKNCFKEHFFSHPIVKFMLSDDHRYFHWHPKPQKYEHF